MGKIIPSTGRKHARLRAAPALVILPRGVFPARRQTPGAVREGLPNRHINLTRVSVGRFLNNRLPNRLRSRAGEPGRRVPLPGGAVSIAVGWPSSAQGSALRPGAQARSASRVGRCWLRGGAVSTAVRCPRRPRAWSCGGRSVYPVSAGGHRLSQGPAARTPNPARALPSGATRSYPAAEPRGARPRQATSCTALTCRNPAPGAGLPRCRCLSKTGFCTCGRFRVIPSLPEMLAPVPARSSEACLMETNAAFSPAPSSPAAPNQAPPGSVAAPRPGPQPPTSPPSTPAPGRAPRRPPLPSPGPRCSSPGPGPCWPTRKSSTS